jgi:hypothetical protein
MQPTNNLTPNQLTFLDWVTRGLSILAAAKEIDVPWAQIMAWKRSIPAFHLALEEALDCRALLNRERAQDLFYEALQVVEQVMRDRTASPSLRLRASLAAIRLSAADPQAKRKVQPKLQIVHNPAQAKPIHESGKDSAPKAATAEPAAA